MSNNNIIYLAGLFDGEGCIYARVIRNSTIEIRLEIHSPSNKMRAALIEILDEHNIYYISSTHNYCKLATRPIHRCVISRKKESLKLLTLLVPYLRVKKEEALLAIEILTRMCSVSKYKISDIDRHTINTIKYLKKVD